MGSLLGIPRGVERVWRGGAAEGVQDGGTPALASPRFLKYEVNSAATPMWVRGQPGGPCGKENLFSDGNRGHSQQEELGGDGGEKGEDWGVFHFH